MAAANGADIYGKAAKRIHCRKTSKLAGMIIYMNPMPGLSEIIMVKERNGKIRRSIPSGFEYQ